MLYIALIVAVLVLSLVVFPNFRAFVLAKLGITPPTNSLSDIIADLESKIETLLDHADSKTNEATEKRLEANNANAAADAASAEAVRATKIANNVKTLVAV